jgi:hypothetical protein
MSTKKKFSPKINQNRAANKVFDLTNDFHGDRLSFLVNGEKIDFGHFRLLLRLAVLKVQNFRRARHLVTFYGESKKKVSR